MALVHQQVPSAQSAESAPTHGASSSAQPTPAVSQSESVGRQPEDSNPRPRNPSQRTCNKYWVVDVLADNGMADEERLCVRDLLVLPPHKRKRFVMDNDDHYHYCMGNMGKKWKDNRWRLANEIYEKDKNFQENLDLYPEGMTREQWASFLTYKTSEKAKKYIIINTANRQKQTIPHTLGSKTLARRKRELEIQEGRKFSRGEMYAVSHIKKDGNFVNEEARLKNDNLIIEMDKANFEDEAFVNVFGKEHPGRVRGMGFGVVPSQIRRTSTSSASTSCSGPTQAEYDALKGELDTIKGKMAEFDTLKSQMAHFTENFVGHSPSNQVVDLGSPGIRKSSHASHDPSDGPTISNQAPQPPES
ncbi:uncharacterized protein LOC133286367 [Gastrolobium bilobum]|uniref:uncharacterized protein LOC133286367 n=1 Tax=Gastrolobium bilobum TaxID=150636 RepID=UPI002AB1B555|nr:uncharacterized protein LOC133286367 [Gastrolobium bilobum]